jgi:hypothetical protein
MRLRFKPHGKIALFSLGFVALAISCATLWNQSVGYFSVQRAPASDQFDSEGDVIYSVETIKDLEAEGRRSFHGQRPKRSHDGHIFTDAKNVTAEAALKVSGVPTIRAREARFDLSEFAKSISANEHRVELNLFDDVRMTAVLRPSSYAENQGIYTGYLPAEPSGQVRLFVQDSSISGTIETSRRKFRIIELGSEKVLIIEEDNKKP